MSRSIAFIWVSLALFIVVLYIVLRVFVMRSFAEMETAVTARNVERVQRAIAERIASIDSKATDWAAWDDAYQFIRDRNDRFIRSNFALSAFTGNKLNLIAYVRNSGEIVYARWYYPGTGRMVPLPDDVRQAIFRQGRLTRHRDVHGSVSGIVMLRQGPMLVASRPVVTSNEQGPIRGSLIFGQLLGPEEVRNLSHVTRVSTAIVRLDRGDLREASARAQTGITKAGQVAVRPISRNKVAGYTALDDLYGKPALMLRVDMPRTLYQRGLALSSYTLASLVILSLLFGSAVSLLLVRTVHKEREFDRRTHEFYRRTITAATNGKLMITDDLGIGKLCGTPVAQWKIQLPSDLYDARNVVLDVASSSGFEEDRAWDFATSIGEAVTNAIKHAGGGEACLCRRADGLLFVVSDHGPGIPALALPDVALRKGYSTAGTLGMGYKMMISLADKVYLATGPKGTTVAIEIKPQAEEPSLADVA